MTAITDAARDLVTLDELEEAIDGFLPGAEQRREPAGARDAAQLALVRCRELRVERTVAGAREALVAGEGGAREWVARLARLAPGPWSQVRAELQEEWSLACLAVAVHREDEEGEALLAVASSAVQSETLRTSIQRVRLLLQSRRWLREGSPGTAIAASREVEGGPVEVRALALETVAEAFRMLGDVERERQALEQWAELFAEFPGGPCEQAGRLGLGREESGPAAERRKQAVLGCQSRRARLAEAADEQEAADVIFKQFMDCGYHDWVDPSEPGLGTIRQRANRLRDRTAGSGPEGKPQEFRLHEVKRPFHDLVAEEDVEALIGALRSCYADEPQVVLLVRAETKENKFRHDRGLGVAGEQLCGVVSEIALESSWAELSLRARLVWSVSEAGRSQIMLIEHGVTEPTLSDLVFAVRLAVIGDSLEVSIFTAVAGNFGGPASDLAGLAALVRTDLAGLPGFEVLRDRIVGIVVEAGRRVANRATALGIGGNHGGDAPAGVPSRPVAAPLRGPVRRVGS